MEAFEGLLRRWSPDSYDNTIILDLGCGTGTYPKALLEAGLKSGMLVDGSKQMLKICEEKMKRSNITNFETQVYAFSPTGE